MLSFDPIHRPSISEIMNHPWTLGETATEDEILEEFKERESVLRGERNIETTDYF